MLFTSLLVHTIGDTIPLVDAVVLTRIKEMLAQQVVVCADLFIPIDRNKRCIDLVNDFSCCK
jgi:hypothetical protein